MAITATFAIKLPDVKLDARELVTRASDAAIETLQATIIGGVDPETGQARERKADGKPVGYNTGRLANGLHRTSITGGKSRASTVIAPPADRADYVASMGDILSVGGIVGQAIDEAVDEYLAQAT